MTRPSEAVQRLVAAAIRGVEDVAPAVAAFHGHRHAARRDAASRSSSPRCSRSSAEHGFAIRSPTCCSSESQARSCSIADRSIPFGVGIAIFTALLTAHVLPPVVLVAAIMAVVQVQNVCDPTNTANVWVANFTGVPIDTITKRTLPYQTARRDSRRRSRSSSPRPRSSASGPSSALVRQRAGRRDAAGILRAAFSRAIGSRLTTTGRRSGALLPMQPRPDLRPELWQAIRLHEDPNASDCAQKRYAAYLYVAASNFALIEGDDLDVGLRLEDCGGWIVDGVARSSSRCAACRREAQARALALQGVARLRAWALAEPIRSANLFRSGVAARAGDKPTYFYAFFRSADGNLRAYVRAGGPAYVAGLRSGDVVETIDG